jgi:HD-GYP domain-containing protein (c-di-GMP phosphodiesterase class II)
MLAEISRALERRDRTRGHGERVAALAEAVAVRLAWSEERLVELRFAAPLHDIGKVAVSATILAKRAPLTPEERVEMQRHPIAGAELLQELGTDAVALPYVLYHHERWDGGGYPTGKRGREIPVEGRIIAVTDAFDAMTSSRPYRRSLSVDRALDEIERCAGTQFDPEIAAVFVEVWTDGVLGELPAAAAF